MEIGQSEHRRWVANSSSDRELGIDKYNGLTRILRMLIQYCQEEYLANIYLDDVLYWLSYYMKGFKWHNEEQGITDSISN